MFFSRCRRRLRSMQYKTWCCKMRLYSRGKERLLVVRLMRLFPEERFHDLGQHKGIFVICGACKASAYQTGAYKAKRNPRKHEFPSMMPERQRRFWRVVGTDMVSEPRPRQEARCDAPITSSESADGLSAICQKERDGQSTGRANNGFLKKRNMFHLVECR